MKINKRQSKYKNLLKKIFQQVWKLLKYFFFILGMIENSIVDYLLRCIKGIFRGRFIYLNLTEEGNFFYL